MSELIPSILHNIVLEKKKKVQQSLASLPLNQVRALAESQEPPRAFVQALRSALAQNKPAVIAEIKKASPSQGVIREDFDPVSLAKNYESHGATCLSILTDEPFFKGSDQYLQLARASVALPVLRKDFMIDPYQIYESRALGADCVLLIAAILEAKQLNEMAHIADALGMGVLVEVHDVSELDKLNELAPGFMLGINNRDLHTFNVSLETSLKVHATWESKKDNRAALMVSESGIHRAEDISYLRNAGIGAFLIGESFMRASNPGLALANLFAQD